MKFGISEMKKILFWLIYLGLAGASFLFVKETLEQYHEGVTYFQETKSVMSVRDIPTLTICFEDTESLEFGKHFTVENYKDQSKLLKEGKNVPKSDQSMSYDLFLKTMKVFQHVKETKRRCIAISPMTENRLKHQNLRPYMQLFDLRIIFNSSFSSDTKSSLYITSEENSYGVTGQKWFEGEVKEYPLKFGRNHYINVQVKELQHLPDRCHKQPFYVCLADKISKNTSCSNSQCTTITLPTNTKFIDFDQCKTEEEHICKEKVLMSMVQQIQDKNDICNGNLEPPCTAKEYMLKDISEPKYIPGNPLGFHITIFFNPPHSSHGVRENRPLKTVYTERYILDELQVIGILGGTFGLMIGFSFMGSIESISEFAFGLIQRKKRSQQKMKSRKQTKHMDHMETQISNV